MWVSTTRCDDSDDFADEGRLSFSVQTMAGTINIDCSDEDLSNWMRFVRPADTWAEQNLVLTQEGDKLYFISTRNIHPKQELRVGYSEAYAKARGLPYLSPQQSSQLTPGLATNSILFCFLS